MHTAYVGLGSNLHHPCAQLHLAIKQLGALPGVTITASTAFYENPPLGAKDQPPYVNAVLALSCTLSPQALLLAMQVIEYAQGRRRDGQIWAPRTLDMDLLLYDNLRLQTPLLTLPHPHLTERCFVVLPLLMLAPDLCLPSGRPLSEYRDAFPLESLHEIPDQADLDLFQLTAHSCR